MAYRAQPRRVRPGSGRNGGSASFASKIALARALSRPPKKSGSVLPLVLTLIVLSIVTVIATSGAIGAGAAAAYYQECQTDLPEVGSFENIQLAQPTIVYDRTGTVELARFQAQRREVKTFDQIPELVLDSTIAVEDHTFWDNPGYDPQGILAAAMQALQGRGLRGASTITQQFVRAIEVGLLPADVIGSDDASLEAKVMRKCKEIIQANNLTTYVQDTYGLEAGKQRILTAYLNQIFYGHNAYGIAAAARVYFDKALEEVTPAEAALLSAIPQSPTCYDLYRWVPRDETGDFIRNAEGRIEIPRTGYVRPADCPLVEDVADLLTRRDFILSQLREGVNPVVGSDTHSFGRWTSLTSAQIEAAKAEPIILADEVPVYWKAPHFVWAMKDELTALLSDRAPAETGGYRVITTLDMEAQLLVERYTTAATILAQLNDPDEFADAIRQNQLTGNTPDGTDRDWINKLRRRNVDNAAMVVEDYRTGDLLGYVGSAGYYREDLASPRFDPKFDVVAGYRQPGSAFKPIVYTTAIEEHAITAGTPLLDITTSFRSDWDPKDADLLERGPLRARDALMYSLNIPAIRVLDRVGIAPVAAAAERAGITTLTPKAIQNAGLAGAIGTVEVRLSELTAAFGALANEGKSTRTRTILEIDDNTGQTIYTASDPVQNQVWSPQAAWLMANILEGNTNPDVNLAGWGYVFHLENGPSGQHRPMGLKTGTTNDTRDLTTFGMLAPPDDPDAPGLAVGVWMGNSDHSQPTLGNAELFGIDGPGRVFYAFMRDYTKDWPIAQFQRPNKGLVEETIDAYSGGRPGPWTKDTIREWFLTGTEPGARNAIDPAGLLYRQACGGEWFVDPLKIENADAPDEWKADVREWTARARTGAGVRSTEFKTSTTYLYGLDSWGGPIIPEDPVGCASPTPSGEPSGSGEPTTTPDPTEEPRTCGPDDARPRCNPTPSPTDEVTPPPDCNKHGNPPGCNPTPPPPTEPPPCNDRGRPPGCIPTPPP
ncbi:MAG: transglycosylase domain-containing protein, partial [Candidatus Limnocylindrales bacterium]